MTLRPPASAVHHRRAVAPARLSRVRGQVLAVRRWGLGAVTAALLLGTGACTWAEGNPYVLVASEPPGASILVDGDDSGLTTPARLELGGFFGSSHEITVRKAGFQPETRAVYHYSTYSTSRWIDGAAAPEVWSMPFFWTPGDFLFPFSSSWNYVPAELYIRLYRDGEPRPGGTTATSKP